MPALSMRMNAVNDGANRNYENGRDIRARAFAFACRAVQLCQILHASDAVGRLLAPQILSSSTSVSAMLEEARAAESRRDFISKLSIALKECREAHGRLRVLGVRGIGPTDEVCWLVQEADQLVAIVSRIIGNTKRNAGVLPRSRTTNS